jgi:dTDP-4-amino-4,6-dideoxygalactose transaminase
VTRQIPIAAPSLGDEEWQALREPLESGWLTQGPKVAAFEEAFATRHGVSHALAVTSCTTGLHLLVSACDIGPGDEVIVPAFTWVATANVVLQSGATPVFADVDPITYNIDPAEVGAKLTDRTRAVIAVHLFGLCADMDALRSVLPDDVLLLEDAACAAGATYHGRSAGSIGRGAAFSFHPRKSITTGEGGMLTTNDAELAARAEIMRNHGASVSEEARHAGNAPFLMPEFDELGFNYRMTDLQAAVGLVQLGKLDRFVAERARWARWYDERLAGVAWLSTPAVPDGYGHAWQAYVTRVETGAPESRNEIMRRLHADGVSTRPGTHAVSELSFHRRRLSLERGTCPVAADLEARTMALPLHNRMTDADYEYVVERILAL